MPVDNFFLFVRRKKKRFFCLFQMKICLEQLKIFREQAALSGDLCYFKRFNGWKWDFEILARNETNVFGWVLSLCKWTWIHRCFLLLCSLTVAQQPVHPQDPRKLPEPSGNSCLVSTRRRVAAVKVRHIDRFSGFHVDHHSGTSWPYYVHMWLVRIAAIPGWFTQQLIELTATWFHDNIAGSWKGCFIFCHTSRCGKQQLQELLISF